MCVTNVKNIDGLFTAKKLLKLSALVKSIIRERHKNTKRKIFCMPVSNDEGAGERRKLSILLESELRCPLIHL